MIWITLTTARMNPWKAHVKMSVRSDGDVKGRRHGTKEENSTAVQRKGL